MNSGVFDPIAPLVISDNNISYAWGRALWHVVNTPGNEIKPLIISIINDGNGNLLKEDIDLRAAVDAFLKTIGSWSVEIVGFTIFPQRYWQIAGGDRHEFFQIYLDALPYIKAKNPNINRNGLYFERLIDYGKGKTNGNQLEYMITEFLENRARTSKFHASIFDPERDQHRQPYQTFPCLQTVSFVPTDAGLVVNAFYAMQYLVQRGYGNFLGLAHLGAFMASEFGLNFVQLNVIAGVEKLDFSKTAVSSLVEIVGRKVPDLYPNS